MKVVKFGGSSLADAESILRAKEIVFADASRSFIVVSAPGKCKEFPHKITDLLIEAYAEMQLSGGRLNEKSTTAKIHNGETVNSDNLNQKQNTDTDIEPNAKSDKNNDINIQLSESLTRVFDRFRTLSNRLNTDIDAEIRRTYDDIVLNKSNYDFVISRGEYLMAILFARVLGFKFVDAANYIVIKRSGKYYEKATCSRFTRCVTKNDKIVMGGFYGSSIDGGVKVFTRGGSDYSGAIAAVCLKAEVYENFTDTYGVQTANPAVVKDTKSIKEIDFLTMHKLSVAGASVLHPDCLPLLKSHAMPLKVDNTFDSGKSFTRIGRESVCSKYFCITYKFEQNINKDTVEILCAFNKISVGLPDLRTLFRGTEVYLVRLDKKSFTLIAPAANLNSVINLLHDYFVKL